MEPERNPCHGNEVSGRRWLTPTLTVATMALLALVGCDSAGTAPRADALVQVTVTDAPSDYIESAEVWISKVYLIGAPESAGVQAVPVFREDADSGQAGDTLQAEDDSLHEEPGDSLHEEPGDSLHEEDDSLSDAGGGPQVLFDDPDHPFHVDLLVLRDGLVADLTGAMPVAPGAYHQLRIVVDSAWVTLKDPYTFSDGSSTARLKIPGGHSAGVKVTLQSPVVAQEGDQTTILLDFAVDDNFRIQGNPATPAGIRGVLFTPVIKERGRKHEHEEHQGGGQGG